MEVHWTVHIPQAMQQHGGGPRLRQDPAAKNASVKTTPALETKAGDTASQSRPDEPK
jgi:hypothetical protein